MTPIPEDHEAARALRAEFDRLGQERATAHRWRRALSSRRSAKSVLVGLAALLTAGAVAVAGTKLILDAGSEQVDKRTVDPRDARSPADTRLSTARVEDPDGGPPWGVRLYTSELGLPCVRVGRVKNERLGTFRDGEFRRFVSGTPGLCASDHEDHVVFSLRRAADPAPGRSVLYGVADRAVLGIDLESGTETAHIRIAPDGVFLLVAEGTSAWRDATVVTRYADHVVRAQLEPQG